MMRAFALTLALLLVSFLVTVPCFADEKAPFGLSWGLSKGQVEALGVKLGEKLDDSNGKNYRATNLPKTLNDIEVVSLSFGLNDKLFRVAAASENFDNDPYGTSVKKRYDTLSSILIKKYGPGKATHFVADFYDGANFLYGIKTGQSWHYTNFSTNNLFIQLGIKASDTSTGHYILIYENKNLKNRVKERSTEKEKDAL